MALNEKQSNILAFFIGAGLTSVIVYDIANNLSNANTNTNTNTNVNTTSTLTTNPLTANLDSDTQNAIQAVADALGVPADWVSAAIYDESAFNPKALNPKNGNPEKAATGAIQFEPGTAKGLGTTNTALYNMTLAQQMPYVQKFFSEVAGPLDTYGDFYLKLLSPAAAAAGVADTDIAPAADVAGNAPLFVPDNTWGSFKNSVTARARANGFNV